MIRFETYKQDELTEELYLVDTYIDPFRVEGCQMANWKPEEIRHEPCASIRMYSGREIFVTMDAAEVVSAIQVYKASIDRLMWQN